MENIILIFLKNIYMIFLGVLLLSFVIPIIITFARNKKQERVLNKYSIFLDSRISSNVFLIFFFLFFVVVGVIIVYAFLKQYDIDKNKSIWGIIHGLIFMGAPTILIINIIKESIKILTGKYVIVIDELMDKYYYNDHCTRDHSTDNSCWWLYFKDYFKKYNAKVQDVNRKRGDLAKEGDKFYLVFVKGGKNPYIYECKNYTLDEGEEDKLKTIDEAKSYINRKEYVLEKVVQNEKTVINKDTIKKDFTKQGHRKTAIIEVCVCVFLILFSMIVIFEVKNIMAIILTVLLTVFWFFLTTVKVKYVFTIYSNINKCNFKIKEDEVISLNNKIQYSDSNHVISFKLKNYKKLVYEDKRIYYDTQIGDKFYLVFVKGEKEPIKVYNSKNSYIGEENNK